MHRGTVGSCVPRFARVEFRNACRQAPPASLELRGSLRRERGSTSLVVCRLGGGALVGSFAGHSWGSRLGGAVLGESSWKGPQAVRSSWGSRLGGVVLEVVVCKIPMGPNESLWNPIGPLWHSSYSISISPPSPPPPPPPPLPLPPLYPKPPPLMQ